MDERGRSTEDILQDIAREEESLSRTAQQIGDRIKEKLDWSEYVKESPYWALGIAGGIGFFCLKGVAADTYYANGANHEFPCRRSSRLTGRFAWWSRSAEPCTAGSSGNWNEARRRVDKECKLDKRVKRVHQNSIAERM